MQLLEKVSHKIEWLLLPLSEKEKRICEEARVAEGFVVTSYSAECVGESGTVYLSFYHPRLAGVQIVCVNDPSYMIYPLRVSWSERAESRLFPVFGPKYRLKHSAYLRVG